MHNPARRQTEGWCDSSITGWTTADFSTCLQQLRTRRTMNRTIDATAAQSAIRRINDDVNMKGGDVGNANFYEHGTNCVTV
jgi:hypothetical protein